MLSREEILQAYKCYLYEDAILYVLPRETGDACCYHRDTLSWWVRERASFDELMALEPAAYQPVAGKEALDAMERWLTHRSPENTLLERAIVFAVNCHAGQYRKGSTAPYILHPLEALSVLRSMNASPALMTAGVLHDTVEDTEATLRAVQREFGMEIANLILSNTEDKSHSWMERKEHTINAIATATREERMLLMADKVANLRTMAEDYGRIGEELWKRFGAPKESQEWYYRSIHRELAMLAEDMDCAKVYNEMGELICSLFDETKQKYK